MPPVITMEGVTLVGSGLAARVQRVSEGPLVDASFSSQVAACPVRESSYFFINTDRARSAVNVVDASAVADNSTGRFLGKPGGSYLLAHVGAGEGIDHPLSAPIGSRASADVSDAERHTSDPPHVDHNDPRVIGSGGAFSPYVRPSGLTAGGTDAEGANAEIGPAVALRPIQLPRAILVCVGDELARLARGGMMRTFEDALGLSHPPVDGIYVRMFEVGGCVSLNVVRRNGKQWRSVSIRGHSVRGILSVWRHEGGHNMLAYRDPEAVRVWFDPFRGKVDPDRWNAIMHALNGNRPQASSNTENYWSPLQGLSASSAMEAAEELQARADGFEVAEPVESETELMLDDAAVVSAFKSIGQPYINSFIKFNKKFCAVSARSWNELHTIVDSSGEVDEGLDRGVKFKMLMGPKGDKDQRGKGKQDKHRTGGRSKAMKTRDAARLAKWLGGLEPAIAEGWVRASRPDPCVVPRSTNYLTAYSERRSKHDYYQEEANAGRCHLGVDELAYMVPQMIKDSLTGENAYLGPMSRALIQSLLAIGNIELNPGPVPGLNGGNFGYDGTDLECGLAAGVHFLLHHGVPGDTVLLGGIVGLGPGVINPLAAPHVQVMGPQVNLVTLGCQGGDYIVTFNWSDARGEVLGGTYERVWRGGQWEVEFTGSDGLVTGFPDLDGLGSVATLLGRVQVRDANGNVDVKVPAVLIYSKDPPRIPRQVSDRRVTVVAGTLTINYYRGCNSVAIVCSGKYGASAFIPTPLWGECEKLFASGHSRQVAANNATQVLRTCEHLDGGMMGAVQLAISEAMLPAAMVVSSVASTHRDAAINRARLGKGPMSAFEAAWRGSAQSPDYGAMMLSTPDPPWQAVWAIRGGAALGIGLLAYGGYRYTGRVLTPFVTSSYVQLRDEAVRFAQAVRTPVHVVHSEAVAGFSFEQYADGGYELSDQYLDNAVSNTAPVQAGLQVALRRWLFGGQHVASVASNLFSSPVRTALSQSQFEEVATREQMRLYEVTTWAAERAEYFSGTPTHVTLVKFFLGRVCHVGRRVLELTQTVRDYWDGASVVRVSQESVCVFLSHVCVTAPLSEEWLKKRSRLFYYGIPLIETANLMRMGWSFGGALSNRLFIHCTFAALPLWLGVPVHGLHNLVCVVGQMNLQTGPAMLAYAAAPVVALVALQGVEYVLEKGERWWSSSPMGSGSQFDALFDTPHVAAVDPLLHPMIAPRKPRYAKRSKNEVYQLFPSVLDMASFSNERGNYVHSMHGRVGKATPTVVDDVGFGMVRGVLQDLASSVRARSGLVEPVPFEEFVGKFGPGKQAAYREARLLFDVVGTRPIMRPKLFKDFKADECAAFLKHELNAERADVVKVIDGKRYQYAPSDPRTICPRWLPFQSQMIPYILAMEKHVKRELRERSPELFGVEVRFASGLSIEEMSELCATLMAESGLDCIIDNGDDGMFTVHGVAYYVDGHRWDAHFRREYHHEIIDCYARMGLPSHLTEAMHKLVLRKLRWGQGVRCEIDRNNASGESDTTFRNGLGNFVVKLIALRRNGRLTGAKGEAFIRAATRLGFVYEVAAIQHVFNDPYGDFCARVWLARQLVLKPGRIFSKLCWTCSPSIPFAELRAAKLRAAILDFAAFPEIAAVLAALAPSLGLVTKRAFEVVSAARYSTIGSREASTLEQRVTFFALRYGLAYDEVIADARRWCHAVTAGEFEVSLPSLRRMAEVDMGVTSSPVIARHTDLKLVQPQECMSLTSARARRLREVSAAVEGGRPDWLARAWNSLMHALTGNGSCSWVLLLLMCSLSVGWAGGGNFIVPEQTLSYQRQNIMPNKNKKAGPAVSLPKSQPNRKKKSSKQGARVSAQSVKGDGLYKLLGPLAKMAVNAALPRAMQAAGQRLRPFGMQGVKGSGDYVCNDIVHMGGGHPVKGMAGVPVTKYTHSEYIKDLVVPANPTAFTSLAFSTNAADQGTFPWLSRLATLYTKYKFTKLLFEFRTTTSNYSAAGTLGTVVMAPHYNVDSLPYQTKQVMEAATHAVSSAPSNSVIMGFECAKKDANVTWYNILNDVTIARSNFTDAGYVEIATSGLPGTAGTTLGELWVHYTCELIEPYISQSEVSLLTTSPLSTYAQGNSNLVNPFEVSVFGFQFNAIIAGQNTGFPAQNFKPSYRSSTVPVQADWWTFCTADTGARVLGFKEAGTYVIEYKARLSGAPTASTGAPWTLAAVTGTAQVLSGNNDATAPIVWATTNPWFAYRWVLTVSAGAQIGTTRGAGWTGVSGLTLGAIDMSIYRIG